MRYERNECRATRGSGRSRFQRDLCIECEKWWEDNCLYLTNDASEAFFRAIMNARDLAVYLRIHADAALVKLTSEELISAGNIIRQGVYLPPINEKQIKSISLEIKDKEN